MTVQHIAIERVVLYRVRDDGSVVPVAICTDRARASRHIARLQWKSNRLVRAGDIVSVQEIANRSGKTQQSVCRWIKQGLHGARPFPDHITDVSGHFRLYDWSEVKAWIDDNRWRMLDYPPNRRKRNA